MRKVLATGVATLAILLCALAPSSAQTWPDKPIRFIVPNPAGGGTDVVGRMLAGYLSQRLGQTVFVENRGGANGAIGLDVVKQSNPDGYTLAFAADTPMTVNPWMYKKLPYDPLKDFQPVASAIRLPGMLAAHPSLGVTTIAGLIEAAKKKPGGIAYASAGVGNFSHLAMELFSMATGTKLLHVPYKGTGPASVALLAGEVQVGFNNVQTLIQSVQDGKLTPLGVAELKRMPQLPNLPAVAETVPGFEMAPYVGLFAPAATPKPIVKRLSDEIISILNDPAIAKQFTDQYLTVMALGPDDYRNLIQADLNKWGKVIKAAGIEPE